MRGEQYFNPISLVDALGFRAKHQPDQLAYIFLPDGEFQSGSLTYAQLDEQARTIAGWLQSWCPAGERVLLIYSRPLEFIAAFFGCLYAKVLPVPTQQPTRSRPSRRISAIVADAQPCAILTSNDLLPKLEQQRSQIPGLAVLRNQSTEEISNEWTSAWKDPNISSNDLAFLQYTSGSTATPKGVMVSHSNLLHNLEHIQCAWENTDECVSGTWLPAFHDMGLIEGILQPLYCGYRSYIMPSIVFLQRPIQWLRMITKYKVTNSGGPNSAFDLCVRMIKEEQRKTLDLSSWTFCYNGSEPVRKQTLQQFFEMFQPCGLKWQAIHPGYGLAGATLLVSGGRRIYESVFCTLKSDNLAKNEVVPVDPADPGARTLVSSGPVHLNFFNVAIVNPETLKKCEPGMVGEIWLKSNSIAQGYWNRPEETQRTFHAYEAATGEGPFLRTGDTGFVQEGELFISGRLKDLIIVRGCNHYPQDLELTAEHAHPAIRQSCTAAFVVDEENDQKVVLVCEVNREYLRKLNQKEILGAIRQAIAEEQEIAVWQVFLLRPGSIPKTSSGKIQRQRCKEMLLAGDLEILENSERVDPETPIDLKMGRIDESPAY